MDDGGITLTGLTVGGASLAAISGVVGAWIKARYGHTRISPQPLEVKPSEQYVKSEECIEHRRIIEDRQHELESDVRGERKNLTEALTGIRKQLEVSDGKAETRSCNLHKRIDPLVESLGGVKGRLDQHLNHHPK